MTVRIFTVTSLLLSTIFTFGQVTEIPTAELKKMRLRSLAKTADRMGETYIAIEYYKQLHQIEPDNLNTLESLADKYRLTRNYALAEECYEKLYKADISKQHMALYYWALMEKMNGKHETAKEHLLMFKKVSGEIKDQGIKKLYKSELEGCDLALSYKDSTAHVVYKNLPRNINHPHIDFSPIPLNNHSLIYGALKVDTIKYFIVDSIKKEDLPSRKFFTATKSNHEWKFNGELPGPFNDPDVDVANGDFSLDSSRFYFTKCGKNWQYKNVCTIWYCEKNGDGWSEPIIMDENINLKDYTSSHPTISRDPKKQEEIIYFVSDRPGGKGGMDIWYTMYDAKKKSFKMPKNAGSKINTPGDELTPFYNLKTKTLYFSSNGYANIGGLDIFSAKGEGNKFEPPVNLGLPINSQYDDLDFALNPDNKGGYFVSNRPEGQSLHHETCCDDIYEFSYTNFIESIYLGRLIDKETKQCINQKTEALIYITDPGSPKFLAEKVVFNNCNYRVALVPGHDYEIRTTNGSYLDGITILSTRGLVETDSVVLDIEMEKIPEKPISIPNIHFAFGSHDLTDAAKTAIDSSVLKLMLLHEDLKVEIGAHTDSKGEDEFNMKLSQKRAESVVKYMISKGILPIRLVARGYGESKPIAPNTHADGSDNPEGREQNRRTAFHIIGKIDLTTIEYEEPEENW